VLNQVLGGICIEGVVSKVSSIQMQDFCLHLFLECLIFRSKSDLIMYKKHLGIKCDDLV